TGREGVFLWELESGEYKGELPCPGVGGFHGLALSPSGNQVPTAFGDTVKLWDLDSTQEILTLPVLDPEDKETGYVGVAALGFWLDGHRLIAALSDGPCQYWEATPPPTVGGAN